MTEDYTLVEAEILFKGESSTEVMTFCIQDEEQVRGLVNDDKIFYYGDDPRKFVGKYMNQDFKVISIT